MYFASQRVSLLILGITALVFSRTLFFFFNDPEGPNLLIVLSLAVVLYVLSFLAYVYSPVMGPKKLLLAIVIQIGLVTGLYFLA